MPVLYRGYARCLKVNITGWNYGVLRCGLEIVERFAVPCRRNDINLMSVSTPFFCSARHSL